MFISNSAGPTSTCKFVLITNLQLAPSPSREDPHLMVVPLSIFVWWFVDWPEMVVIMNSAFSLCTPKPPSLSLRPIPGVNAPTGIKGPLFKGKGVCMFFITQYWLSQPLRFLEEPLWSVFQIFVLSLSLSLSLSNALRKNSFVVVIRPVFLLVFFCKPDFLPNLWIANHLFDVSMRKPGWEFVACFRNSHSCECVCMLCSKPTCVWTRGMENGKRLRLESHSIDCVLSEDFFLNKEQCCSFLCMKFKNKLSHFLLGRTSWIQMCCTCIVIISARIRKTYFPRLCAVKFFQVPLNPRKKCNSYWKSWQR